MSTRKVRRRRARVVCYRCHEKKVSSFLADEYPYLMGGFRSNATFKRMRLLKTHCGDVRIAQKQAGNVGK
jgi:cytochrome c553